MDHAAKMKFVLAMTKHTLDHIKHYDSGGTVTTQGAPLLNQNDNNNVVSGTGGSANTTSGGIIGQVGDFLGTTDKFQAGSANIQAGTNQGQLNNAYTNVQQGLANQGQLVNTIQPQAAQGVNTQNNLTNQLTQRANGQGPNPALNQLNQATANNTANQAALMASQRGASANPGLIARQAAMQGAANQQTAAGQAATLESQQQIAAQNQLQNLAATQVNQAGQVVNNENQMQQGEQGILQNANTAANNAAVNMQSNVNNANAQTAAANQNNSNGLVGGLAKGLGSALGFSFAEGGEVPSETEADDQKEKYASGGPVSMVGDFISGANNVSTGQLNGVSGPDMPKFTGMGHYDYQGKTKKEDSKPTGKVNDDVFQKASQGSLGVGTPAAAEPDLLGVGSLAPEVAETGAGSSLLGLAPLAAGLAKGGKAGKSVPAMVSPGEIYLSPEKVRQVLKGANPMRIGEHIPGKAKVKDDSYSNDTVPKNLKTGGIVVPRHITTHKHADSKSMDFVRKVAAKKGLK